MVLVLITLVGLMVLFVRSRSRLGRTATRIVLVTGVALFAVGLLPSRNVFPDAWAYRNVFGVNLDRAILASYSDDFARGTPGWAPGPPRRRGVYGPTGGADPTW